MPLVLSVVVGLLLAACTTAPVYLKRQTTGQIVQCGPYDGRGLQSAASAMRETQCISDYQRQGYERVPGP